MIVPTVTEIRRQLEAVTPDPFIDRLMPPPRAQRSTMLPHRGRGARASRPSAVRSPHPRASAGAIM